MKAKALDCRRNDGTSTVFGVRRGNMDGHIQVMSDILFLRCASADFEATYLFGFNQPPLEKRVREL